MSSKVDRYKEKLVELRRLRLGNTRPKASAERAVLDAMDALWEDMSMEERQKFSDTNHLSWPPPRRTEEDE